VAPVDDVTPGSWAELVDALFAEPWPEHAGRYHSNLIHRGMADAGWPLEPSLHHLGLVDQEAHVLRNFKKYGRQLGEHPISEWEWVTLGQHHGLPTRLLDWTYSPLVALHFATASPRHREADGVVWSLDFVRAHERLPGVLRQLLEREGAGAFTTELLDGVAPTLAALDDLSDEPFLLVLEPPSLDARVVNQYSGFGLVSPAGMTLDEWLHAQDEPLARRVIVRADLKAEVRERLDQANVNERVLFPGLDGLSQWLIRYYTSGERPRPGAG
jgi:FRG domain